MISNLDDLEFLDENKNLGMGAFSRVVKVKNKKDNNIYALKIVK
jgi:hypothetical protein